MRCTQYIGLNAVGAKLVQGLDRRDSERLTGMFDEVNLSDYYQEDTLIYRVVVQASPWSSGPMLFCCLETPDGKRLGEWKSDETLGRRGQEFDSIAGTYYI